MSKNPKDGSIITVKYKNKAFIAINNKITDLSSLIAFVFVFNLAHIIFNVKKMRRPYHSMVTE